MEDSREQKQNYLIDNIIVNNYNPEEFLDYCAEQKGSVDIDSWSFQEVIKLVDEFVYQKRQYETHTHEDRDQSDPFESVFSNPAASIEKKGEFMEFEQAQSVKINQSDFAFDYSTPVVTPVAFNSVDFDFLSGTFEQVQPPKPKTKIQSMQRDVDTFSNMGSVNEGPKKGIFNNMNMKKTNQEVINTQAGIVQPKNEIKSTAYQPKVVPNPGNRVEPAPKIISPTKTSPTKAPIPVPVPVPVPVSPAISSNPVPKQEINALQMIKQSIACRKINAKQILSTSNPYVHIQNHQIVSPSMFLPNFVLYHLRVNPIGIEVRRKYKDFQLLRQILQKLYPMTRLPYLNSNNRLSETEEGAIKKQKYMLQSFINDILLNKQFLCSKIAEEFLTLKDESLFKKKFKEYQKLGQIKSIEDLAELSGTYNLFFNQKHYDFCQKIPPFMNVFEAYQQKIRTLYETLSNSIQNSTKILLEISETFSAFDQFIANFNNSTSAIENFISLEGTYRQLSQLHKEWALSFSEQIKLIDGDIRPGFKFDKQNVLQTTKQIMKIRNNITQAYLKRAQRQPITEKYSSSKLQSYKTSLTQPSKNITVLKYQNAYVNSKMASEMGRLFRDLSLKLQRRYGIMAKLQTNIVHNLRNVWDGWAHKAL